MLRPESMLAILCFLKKGGKGLLFLWQLTVLATLLRVLPPRSFSTKVSSVSSGLPGRENRHCRNEILLLRFFLVSRIFKALRQYFLQLYSLVVLI